jgi:hypothetical protein
LAKSYVTIAGLDDVDTIFEAMVRAHLTRVQCIELCDINERTWRRWIKHGAPRWAIRLVMSQRGSLDHLGWKDWEIDNGCLFFNQLSHRYHWTPARLILPLYSLTASHLPWTATADNLSSLEAARKTKEDTKKPTESVPNPDIHKLG